MDYMRRGYYLTRCIRGLERRPLSEVGMNLSSTDPARLEAFTRAFRRIYGSAPTPGSEVAIALCEAPPRAGSEIRIAIGGGLGEADTAIETSDPVEAWSRLEQIL